MDRMIQNLVNNGISSDTMNLPPYRAVIVDLDRTLLHTDKSISDYTVRVLKKWEAAGAFLYAATARPERTIGDYRRIVGFRSVTTLNGARTITPSAVYENPICPDSAASLLDQLCGVDGAAISAETEDGFYASEDIPQWRPKVTDDIRKLPERVKIYKILASHPRLAPDQLEVNVPEDIYSTVAVQTVIQFMSKTATKWGGILQMLQEDRIGGDQAIYFGDDNDDIEPIRMCGCGVAVANAFDSVKAAADAVAESNDEDGVAKYLAGLLDGEAAVSNAQAGKTQSQL